MKYNSKKISTFLKFETNSKLGDTIQEECGTFPEF